MAWAVVTVASGGLPVVDSTAGGHKNIGIPVTEAVGGRGTAVTKVASGGIGGLLHHRQDGRYATPEMSGGEVMSEQLELFPATVELYEFEPGRWRVRKSAFQMRHLRSDLPMPHVISDIMEPTEQVDGNFYTSKSAFRRVGRSLGLTEVGKEKPKPRRETADDKRREQKARRDAIASAIGKYKAGQRSTDGN